MKLLSTSFSFSYIKLISLSFKLLNKVSEGVVAPGNLCLAFQTIFCVRLINNKKMSYPQL